MVTLPPHLPSWFGILFIVILVTFELLFFALPALLWTLIGRQRLVVAFAWRRSGGWEYLGAALLALGFAAAAQVLIAFQNHVWPQGMNGQRASNAFLLPLVQQHPFLMPLAISLSAAFSEELLFRGVLQRALTKRMPAWIAIGLGSVLFSTVHLDLSGFVVRVLFGVLLGTIVLRGHSLFPAMLAHFLYDTVLLGVAAWDIHLSGLNEVMQQVNRANGGLDIPGLACYGSAGLLLLASGWIISVRAWQQKPPMASEPESAMI